MSSQLIQTQSKSVLAKIAPRCESVSVLAHRIHGEKGDGEGDQGIGNGTLAL